MKLHLLLGLSLLSLFTFSCEQDELVQPKSAASIQVGMANATVSTTGRENLLAEAVFEPTLSTIFKKQVYTPYGLTMKNDTVRSGATSARFEMRKGDGQIRSEILLSPETQSNRWYGNSIYLPSKYWETDMDPANWDIITQWHALDDAGEPARVPPLSLNVSKGRLFFTIYWATEAINTNTTVSGKKVFDLGPVEKDKWVDMVYHMNFSYQSDGVLEVWKNGVKVVDFRGPNCFNDQKYPYFKAGIYKRNWSTTTKRVLYMDEVRVGNSSATYNDVVPGNSPQPKPPVPDVLVPVTPSAVLMINNNAVTATTQQATLHITAVNATQMRFYDNSDSTWTSWEPIAATKPWTFSGGNGTKTVYLQVISATGELSATASDEIALDIPPVPTVTMVINNNAATTSSRAAILNITSTNATQMRFYDNSNSTWSAWEPIATTKAWTLSDGDGSKWVKIQVRRAAGLTQVSTSDGIQLKTPTGTPTVTMVINNNAATTSTRLVTLNITGANAAHMRFYDNSNSTWGAWEPFATTKAWTLSAGDGSKWVKVQVKNVNGLMSTSNFDGITLKTL